MSLVVGIDSMILIYAGAVPRLDAPNTEERKALSIRAKILLHELLRDKAKIVISSVAVTELLVPIPPPKHGAVIATLREFLIVRPHDLPAASIAADLWNRAKANKKEHSYTDRNVLKADAMIIAGAKAAGAVKFYSHDKNCRRLAELCMKSLDLPEHADDLFLESELRSGE